MNRLQVCLTCLVLGVLVLTVPAQTTAAEPAAPTAPVQVKLQTSMGDIVIELNTEKAPISCQNFLTYVDEKFYNGCIFHRVISNFMIQGGGFDKDLQKKATHAPIKNEWKNGLKNVRGSIAMARLGRKPDSATSQFFINVQDNPMLDKPNDGAGYAVFGKVVQGMEVIDKIKQAATTMKNGMADVPVENVLIQTAARVLPEPEKTPDAAPEKDSPAPAPNNSPAEAKP